MDFDLALIGHDGHIVEQWWWLIVVVVLLLIAVIRHGFILFIITCGLLVVVLFLSVVVNWWWFYSCEFTWWSPTWVNGKINLPAGLRWLIKCVCWWRLFLAMELWLLLRRSISLIVWVQDLLRRRFPEQIWCSKKMVIFMIQS